MITIMKIRLFSLCAAYLLGAHTIYASLDLGSLFTDHMVLQRDMPVPVWGNADPGTSITVVFADQEQATTADADGKWMLKLSPLSASVEPRAMTVSSSASDDEPVVLSDVLVGEVWICSGQSNMQFSVNSVPKVKALVPHAQNIRCFEVKRTVAFTEQERCEGQWSDTPPPSAVAFAFAHCLQQQADVPIGILLTCWGSSSLEAWMPRDMVDTVPHFKTMMAEFDADEVTQKRIQSILDGKKPWSKGDDVFLRRQTNVLYNAMLAPLAPYAARGLVWYQGERNTQSMHGMIETPWFSRNSGMLKYGATLKAWIERTRQEWGQDEFQFLAVMLPGYYKALPTGPQTGAESPIAHSWGWMRESQLQALELPNTGVANTIDLGDVKNIHPRDKFPVGERLALLAARDTLGIEVEAEGPVMQQVSSTGGTLVVQFTHAAGMTTTDGAAPSGFWIADDSANWVPATAQIQGETVVLSAAELNQPLYVRYAFAGKPTVNLVNGAGLPAYPFRNDTFTP
ncbi:Sialic acid-specific 9-O-acetylesterase [Lentimonas sp. CC4]|nr:Sialic acid-specific 9-O-acetylesterase [Lentimonas sp. CC4]CAA6683858.1 Sialic acid-specific 9-O-acetylesterase [Lentimonas sp. CC6]CAA7077746.1 Sialic acid-specific 9-O-acetylesterase [Lentimonas sp. CC4]CAA7169680.1 Sialic acid-specific 9-O-acetylesterase [Lentimonas sp. CC21]CAA7179501.1 Sialic acid-specific 9-O-acetylesterase [Lentimonas sp. CC8]